MVNDGCPGSGVNILPRFGAREKDGILAILKFEGLVWRMDEALFDFHLYAMAYFG